MNLDIPPITLILGGGAYELWLMYPYDLSLPMPGRRFCAHMELNLAPGKQTEFILFLLVAVMGPLPPFPSLPFSLPFLPRESPPVSLFQAVGAVLQVHEPVTLDMTLTGKASGPNKKWSLLPLGLVGSGALLMAVLVQYSRI